MSKLYCSEITWNKKNIENFNNITPVENDWVFVSGSIDNGYAIKSNGTLWTWGNNNLGQLGNNTSITSTIPTQEILGLNNWTSVTGTTGSTLALTSTNELYHSGGANNVKILMHQTSASLAFIKYNIKNIQFKSILAGSHIGGLDINGYLYCAGNNNYGQCAQNTINFINDFTREYTNSIWTSFALGSSSTHGIKADGTLWSIGLNTYGNLGNNTNVNSIEFVQEATFSTNWKQVVSKYDTVCAIKTDGTLWTWGRNTRGILGINSLTPTFVSVPTQETTFSTNWSNISMGSEHILALKTDGSLFAWGSNTIGQVGINSGTLNIIKPTIVSNGSTWSSISASNSSSYGIKTDGTLWSWGYNNKYQLGLNDTVTRIKPTQVLISPVLPATSTTSTTLTTSTSTTPSPIINIETATTAAETTSTTTIAPETTSTTTTAPETTAAETTSTTAAETTAAETTSTTAAETTSTTAAETTSTTAAETTAAETTSTTAAETTSTTATETTSTTAAETTSTTAAETTSTTATETTSTTAAETTTTAAETTATAAETTSTTAAETTSTTAAETNTTTTSSITPTVSLTASTGITGQVFNSNIVQYIGTNQIKMDIPDGINATKLAEYIAKELNYTISKMIQDNNIMYVYVEEVPTMLEQFNDTKVKQLIFIIDSKEKRDMLLQMDLNKILNECNCNELKQTNKIDITKVLLFIIFLIILIIIIKYITK
jgi:alpha-tubulin suppressor-like RCC1 family protein